MKDDDLYLAMVTLVLGMGDDAGRAAACEALLERDEVVTVRVGRGEEPTVFRADVTETAAAAQIARDLGARLGVEPRHVDVRMIARSTDETYPDSGGS